MTFQTLDSSNKQDHTQAKAFLDESGTTTVARYDRMKYRVFDRLTEEHILG